MEENTYKTLLNTEDHGKGIARVNSTKSILKVGNSLCVVVTKECRMLDVHEGDLVEVTVRKVCQE